MKRFEIEIDGRHEVVFAERSAGTLWFHWRGKTHAIESEKRMKKSGSSAASSKPGEIIAPMPGKITKVLVKKGDKVSLQMPMVVMEAMKMEYTLEANLEGIVKEVGAQVGEQVLLNQLLVQIEATP